ncbi:hypothetical protein SAMN04487977_10343 [Treponema bryantii]|uniref:SnoaL-like domain-containing protein n=1 Tax=Treponema bryantii TaxID=163 RepID=A0A1H9E6L6_9SPIR|nr:nuclear transport factor 2 family protein [Treponema bryantii]BDC94319.1 hypothetical protein TRBR_24160 [Treponema bryantii]SEQ21396.1 hypothetical protein SAMN04487977_10343 [Treponema bryantii]
MKVEEFWNAVILQNREKLPSFFTDDAVIRWHCTNEQFSVLEYVRVNCDYPGKWKGEIERIEKAGETIILAGHVVSADDGSSFHVVSFIKLKNDKIAELDEYWADDGEPPEWRRGF